MKSNFQKMHSALTDVYMVLMKAHMDNCPIPTGELVRALGTIESALALKPQNCDVGTAEEQEERFKNFCLSYYEPCNVDGECWKCPLFKTKTRCPIAWAQMPYEPDAEKEGAEE